MANQYVTIDSIVKSALGDKEESNHLYLKYLRLALKGYKEFNFDYALESKKVLLDVLPYNAVNLPCDYVDYIKIGFPLGDRMVSLVPSNDLNEINLFEDGEEVANPIVSEVERDYDDIHLQDGYWYGMYYNNAGEHLGRKFGKGGGSPGPYFTVMKEKEQIQFSSDICADKVYLEYITNGLNASGGTLVHQYAAATLESYIHWRLAHHKQPNSGEAAALKVDYQEQLRRYKARVNPLTTAIIKDIANKEYRQSPKN